MPAEVVQFVLLMLLKVQEFVIAIHSIIQMDLDALFVMVYAMGAQVPVTQPAKPVPLVSTWLRAPTPASQPAPLSEPTTT